MQYQKRKKRLSIAIMSLSLFVVSMFGLRCLMEGTTEDTLLGFNINENSDFPWNLLSFNEASAAENNKYPNGDVVNNVIFIDLKNQSDLSNWLRPEDITQTETILNGHKDAVSGEFDSDALSLRNYIRTISYDSLLVESVCYTKKTSDGSIAGYSASDVTKERSYFTTPTASKTALQLEDELLRDVLSQFNTDGHLQGKNDLDTNQDGILDNVTFVIRGVKDQNHSLLWPHQFVFDDKVQALPSIAIDATNDLKVESYNIILSGEADGPTANEGGVFNSAYNDLGVIAHEYLHVYDFPDLYHNYTVVKNGEKYDYTPVTKDEAKGDPLGKWDIMDYTQAIPQFPLQYSNKEYSPWKGLVPNYLEVTNSQDITLHAADFTSSQANAVMIRLNESDDEYFLVEYRKNTGWDAGLPGSGLIVYRINTVANDRTGLETYCTENNCGNMFGIPDEVFIFRPNVTSSKVNAMGNLDPNLDQAFLSAATTDTLGLSLEEATTEHANTLAKTIYYSNGDNSGIVISEVSDATQDTITFHIDIPDTATDVTAPIVADASGNGIAAPWVHGEQTISVNVSDQGKGIAEISVTTSDGVLLDQGSEVTSITKTYTALDKVKSTPYQFHIKQNGTYQVIAKDLAGNSSTMYPIKVSYIDNINPTIVQGKATINADNKILQLQFEDNESGIDSTSAKYTTLDIKASNEGVLYTQEIHDNSILLPVDFNGKVCAQVKDNAGNISEEHTCWIISDDDKAPTLSSSKSKEDGSWTNDTIVLQMKAQDLFDELQSGIAYIEITTENGILDKENQKRWLQDYGSSGKKDETYSIGFQKNGEYHIKVCDYAQNCTEETITIQNIDQSAPVLSDIKIENVKKYGTFTTNAHTISFIAHDEPITMNSGLKEVRYQIVSTQDSYEADLESDAWKVAAIGEVIQDEEGIEGIVYAYVVDQVGNHSKVFEKKVARVQTLVNNAFTAGLHDKDETVSILGLDDPLVSIAMRSTDVEAVKAMLSEAYLSKYKIENLYDFTLTKNGTAYVLEKEVTIRLAISETLAENGTLKIVGIDELGNVNDFISTLGEGYVEFKTNKLMKFATVSEIAQVQPTTVETSPQTGDGTKTLAFLVSALLAMGCISCYVGKKQSYRFHSED